VRSRGSTTTKFAVSTVVATPEHGPAANGMPASSSLSFSMTSCQLVLSDGSGVPAGWPIRVLIWASLSSSTAVWISSAKNEKPSAVSTT